MKPRIVFFGTPEMARISLAALADAGADIAAVVSKPDTRAGRGRRMRPPAVKVEALERGLEVVQPESVRNPEFLSWLKGMRPDLLVVIAYGHLLPRNVLDVPRIMPVNLHFSLLPAWRGPAPVNWAVANGDFESGVTTMLMDAGMDTGPVLIQWALPIDRHETAGELSARLSYLGADLLVETVDRISRGEVKPQEQDDTASSYAGPLRPTDGHLDFTRPAREVEAWARGMTPWPGPFASLGERRIKLFDFDFDTEEPGGEPGEVVEVGPRGLKVAAGRGHVLIGKVQHPGKKAIPAKAAAGGSGPRPGDRLT